jgi:alkanesulfonate monooxygenase SsuD/methylene tetrahydromethanopterin reductase-like flavin-dependent oxidoreductase (luciferase family)
MLDRQPEELGEWLSDGAAFEAAGADALFADFARAPELDPLAMTAALAAVTVRALLVMPLPVNDGLATARALGTIDRLSHGRIRVLVGAISPGELTRIAPGLGVFRRVSASPEVFEHIPEPGAVQAWSSAPSPDSRAAWRQSRTDAAGHGFAGLLVPAGPRLLDILRNPDDQGDRRDLQLAQG